jgi:hypothetical protein
MRNLVWLRLHPDSSQTVAATLRNLSVFLAVMLNFLSTEHITMSMRPSSGMLVSSLELSDFSCTFRREVL